MADDITKDQNFIAYNADLAEGKLDELKGQYVAYSKGKFVSNAENIDSLFGRLDDDQDYFIQQAGIEQKTVRLRSPRIVRK